MGASVAALTVGWGDESAWTNADAAEAQMQSREEVHALMQTAHLGEGFRL